MLMSHGNPNVSIENIAMEYPAWFFFNCCSGYIIWEVKYFSKS